MRYDGEVVSDRSAKEATDYIIWTTWTLLALLAGTGLSFVVWSGLHRFVEYRSGFFLVATLGLATLVFAIRVQHPLLRAFLYIAATMLVFSYVIGPLAFAELLS